MWVGGTVKTTKVSREVKFNYLPALALTRKV